jgi:hypothetical protein
VVGAGVGDGEALGAAEAPSGVVATVASPTANAVLDALMTAPTIHIPR